MSSVKDIIDLMELIAPQHLAEEWDNSGLQCGDPDWPVKQIVVALDPSPAVVDEACQKKADLLITHHPLVFNPLKKILLNTPVGRIIKTSISQKIAVFSAHTNLDSVKGGLNDVFAEKIGMKNLRLLHPEPYKGDEEYKLVVYAPKDSYDSVLSDLLETDAGIIDNYSCCTFRGDGIGTFKPGKESQPVYGKPDQINHVNEVRIETRVIKSSLSKVIDHIRQRHPYETMACDIYPLYTGDRQNGIGRIGELEAPMDLRTLSEKVKTIFQIDTLKVSGRMDMPVRKAAVCTGSGSSLLKNFLNSDADVFISGDLKFHDARDSEVHSRGLIDVGHFASEKLMIDLVAGNLKRLIRDSGLDVQVEALRQEEDPYQYL